MHVTVGAPSTRGVMGLLLRVLAVVLAGAAVLGLGIVFFGSADAVTRVLLSVLALGAAALLAVPATLAGAAWLRLAMGCLIALDAVAVWAIIWTPEPALWLGRLAGMLSILLVAVAAGIVLARVTTGPRVRAARRIAAVSGVAGAVFVALAWAMILSDGSAVPGRVLAGVAIIYAASALGALVLALMRNFEVVRRA